MKKLKYDYSELEEFLEEEYPEKEYLVTQFFKLCQGYMKMASFILNGQLEIQERLTVDIDSADFAASFMTIFQVLGRLPETDDDSPGPDPSINQVREVSAPEEEARDMIRENRMHRASNELELDLPDHIENLIELYEAFQERHPKGGSKKVIPMEESFKKLLEYLERWVQYRNKLWPEE